ncbi:MAG: hypothetical protein AAGA80_15270 [Cyanobacteria bacterium P01_F01_bin.143]
MTFIELQKQVLQLPISDRWRLVQSVLTSIEKETKVSTSLVPKKVEGISDEFHPWTQSLMGVIQLEEETSQSYVDYLEEKYS